jgi:hypothetical protein
MLFPYGYAKRSEGVDGDEIDVFVGPNLEASMVYIVHQRKVDRWDEYDEDKCMICFNSEEDAKTAFLASYDDPRFLGPVTAMPVDEFVAKVKATKEQPAMIKGVVLLVKGFVRPHQRRDKYGRIVHVGAYSTKRPSRGPFGDGKQLVLFPRGNQHAAPPFSPEVSEHPERHTVDMFSGKTKAETEASDAERRGDDDVDLAETHHGLMVDWPDLLHVAEAVRGGINPKTGKPFASEGERVEILAELNNLADAVAGAVEHLKPKKWISDKAADKAMKDVAAAHAVTDASEPIDDIGAQRRRAAKENAKDKGGVVTPL